MWIFLTGLSFLLLYSLSSSKKEESNTTIKINKENLLGEDKAYWTFDKTKYNMSEVTTPLERTLVKLLSTTNNSPAGEAWIIKLERENDFMIVDVISAISPFNPKELDLVTLDKTRFQ